MSRSIFGWSYPPGAAGDPNAPWNQHDGACDVCGQNLDNCICPECPVCLEVGNPACYKVDPAMNAIHLNLKHDRPDHGLVRSLAQVVLQLKAETDAAETDASYEAYASEYDAP
jgi:predicted amidophosphoribosyltransferase